jgi:hypothetical protein
MEPGQGRAEVNALQRLWAALEQLLPADQIAALKQQYVEDAAKDRRQSEYNSWLRRRNQAVHDIRTGPEDTVKRSQLRLIGILTWLETHADWDRE